MFTHVPLGESPPGRTILWFVVTIRTSFVFWGFIRAKVSVLNMRFASSLFFQTLEASPLSLGHPLERPSLELCCGLGWDRAGAGWRLINVGPALREVRSSGSLGERQFLLILKEMDLKVKTLISAKHPISMLK